MQHKPKPGRLAFICGHKDHAPEKGNMLRKFARPDDPKPECPLHRNGMELQENAPYMGQPIPDIA